MANVLETKTASAASHAGQKDRRRPGRPEHVSPELIPLLRGEADPVPEEEQETLFGDPDQLRGARGLVIGAAISAAMWVGIIAFARWVF